MSQAEVKKSRASDSRERIVATTARLLRVQGYYATGLNQIIEESRAPKGSLYHYFPQGKEELAGEALEMGGQTMIDRLTRLFDSEPSHALDTLVDFTIQELQASDYRDGCPLATVGLETSTSLASVRQVCSGIFLKIENLIQAWLRKQGVPEDKVESIAMMVFASYEGALVLSKIHRDPRPLRMVAPQIKAYLAAVFAGLQEPAQ